MRRLWQAYVRPRSVEEALQRMTTAPGPAAWIAGGTDLLLDLEQGRQERLHTLIDVTGIDELQRLEQSDGELFIGAAVPVARVAASPLVQTRAQGLAEACALIAGPQVRNLATLGGNVAHALPAADGTIALLALDAHAEVASPRGRRRVPLAELFRGPGQSALTHDELLVGFFVPLGGPGQASAFRRIMRPQGVALPILNAAVWLHREGDHVADLRIAMGPAGPVPRRLSATEAALRGGPLTPERLAAARQVLLQEARFRTSKFRASEAYRRHLAGVLLHEVLQTAWARAEG